jgi:lipopolysaccharide transport system permease protein
MTAPPAREHLPVHTIRPTRGWSDLGLAELWSYHELLFVFAWRNVLVRYKQTALGIAWAILQPFFLMIVFTLFFSRLGKVSSNGVPYPIFSYAGLLPWTFFATSMTQSATSLVTNQNLLRKIYFPRLILPLSTVITAIVDFAVASVVLAVMMVWYDVYPEPLRLLALPALVLLAVVTALGVGLWLSSVNVLYRDVQYVVPFLAQAWLFATPAVYVATTFQGVGGTLLGLNPMQGVVAGFRWALLDAGTAPGGTVALSAVVSVVVLAGGLVFFRRLERGFADVV